MSAQKRATSFGTAASAYESGRPDYPADAISWMLDPARETGRDLRVADVGAGTGKLTRVVAGLGAELVAVDPDAAMLESLRQGIEGVPTFTGTAEAIPLPDASLDAVVMGQAWHWVEPDPAAREIGRVVRPGGVLGLVWNIRDDRVDWVARLTAAMGGSNAEIFIADGGPRVPAPFGALVYRAWEWQRPITAAQVRDLVLSRSNTITASPEQRDRIVRAVDEVVASVPELADGGTVMLPYVTHTYRAVRD